MSRKSEQLAESLTRLHEILKPGDTVHCVLRHVTRSGMTRHIDVFKLDDKHQWWMSGHAAVALGYRQAKDGSLVVRGCGMDMGFHVVYSLSRTLWPNGYTCSGKGCQSNEHSNPGPDRRNFSGEVWHRDGGYALSSKWL